MDAVLLRYGGYAFIFLALLYLLYLVRGALPVFLVAGLIAYALEPLLRWLEQRGYSRRGAVGFVFLLFLLLMVLNLSLWAMAWQQAQSLTVNLQAYGSRLGDMVREAPERLNRLPLPQAVKDTIAQGATQMQSTISSNATSWLQNAFTWVLGSVGLLLVALVVVPIVTLYLMLEMNPLRARLLMLVPPAYRRDVTEIAGSINALLGRYVRGQIIVCGTFGLLCTIAFHILHFVYGMDYPLVLGILAGCLYIVPYLGMATVALSAAACAYFTSSAPVTCAVIAVACCIVFNLTVDYGISPRVLGKGTGLHPLMVIFALLAGAQVGGVLGMILAVPVAASLRVVMIYIFPQLSAPVSSVPPEVREPPGSPTQSEVLGETREAESKSVSTPA